MSMKSRKRQKMISHLCRAYDDPVELLGEVMKLCNLWCNDRHLVPLTKHDVLRIVGAFLRDRGLIKLTGFEWAAQVIAQVEVGPRLRTVSTAIYRDLLISMVDAGKFTQQQIIHTIMERYPTLNRKSVATFIADCKSWKFTHLENIGLIIEDPDTKILTFDRVSTRPADIPAYKNPHRRKRVSTTASASGIQIGFDATTNRSNSRNQSSVAGAAASIGPSSSQQFMVTVVPVDA